MSVENARAAYPILVRMAHDLSEAARERRPAVWYSYDDLCNRCKEIGVKETPRTVVAKVLKPIQAACIAQGLPDLSAIIIQKPRARSDTGNLIRPSDGWWDAYAESDGIAAGDVTFWFQKFRAARDYAEWPEAPFF